MKRWLLFCGSYEPGADGVGDYTRRLAEQLVRGGNEVGVCALCDRHTAEPIRSSRAPGEGDGVAFLRLPARCSWLKRKNILAEWLGDWQPEVASLQYVPYAYDSRGLPVGLGRWLAAVVTSTCFWHIMLHEIWVGMARISSVKHKLIGIAQKNLICGLVATLRPVTLHVSNALYQSLLREIGIDAGRLPLFPNMAVDNSEKEWMRQNLADICYQSVNRSKIFIAGMFGNYFEGYPLEERVQALAVSAKKGGRELIVLGIGGVTGGSEIWEAKLRVACPSVRVSHYGRQSAARVSAFISCLDIGLVASPREVMGKSSAAATIWGHGVRLDDGYELKFSEFAGRWRLAPVQSLFSSLEDVAANFVKSITLSVNHSLSSRKVI